MDLLSQFNNFFISNINEIKSTLNQFWLTPEQMRKKIEDSLKNRKNFSEIKVIVNGETDNISLYVIFDDKILVFCPNTCVDDNVIISEISPKVLFKHDENLCIYEYNQVFKERLNIPKVILINLYIKDVFPVPRFCLNIGCLTSYLRKYQIADVRIFDMQFNDSKDAVIDAIDFFLADIIGITVTFGQYNLLCEMLDLIFSKLKNIKYVVAGNVISFFAHQELLKKYPMLLVCNNEGEKTLLELCKNMINHKTDLSTVPGLSYNNNGSILKNKSDLVKMDDVCFPAMDSLSDLITAKGALTMEMSRGCCHSACTFCPRTHKRAKWQGMSANIAIKQFKLYSQIFDRFKIKPRIFFADEEFIGWLNNGDEDSRLSDIMKGICNLSTDIVFDQDTRIDQVYDPARSKKWHIQRMKTLQLCKKAGIDRLLVGVESGSNSILERFNKKIVAQQSVYALRILSALDIGMRITFITFDPLMNFSELKENLEFLQRKDVFLKPVDLNNISFERLFDLIHDQDFVDKQKLNVPVFSKISYMLNSLEVLFNSQYFYQMKQAEKLNNVSLIFDYDCNYNMCRHNVLYLDETIRKIAIASQIWVDRNFALDYCLKGYFKAAKEQYRTVIFSFRTRYRSLCLELLKAFVAYFHDQTLIKQLDIKLQSIENINEDQIINDILNIMLEKMIDLVDEIEEAIKNIKIKDKNGKLTRVIEKWRSQKQWQLING